MQKRVIFSVGLILASIHGYTGTPTSTQENDKSEYSGDKLMDETGDASTQETNWRSTSLSAVTPYQQIYIASTKRRTEAEDVNTASASESFYPQFLRNSRHYFQNSEADRFRPITTGRTKLAADQSLLGSGDFGVLKGGTFYQDNEQHPARAYGDFFGGNGHQRPFASPLVQKFRYPSDSNDPFSNFRDFADINVSNDAGQYSELYVVYANKNTTKPVSDEHKKENRIRNIKDQLDLIDNEQKTLKLSKRKLKLRKSKKQVIKSSTTQMPSTAKIDSDNDFMLALS